jgi:UDPglucose 6-dehydrogenase
LQDVRWHATPLEAVEGVDALVVLTEWDEYRTLDLQQVAETMRGKALLDFRNIIDRERAAAVGLSYQGLGRSGVVAQTPRRGHGTGVMARVAASPA